MVDTTPEQTTVSFPLPPVHTNQRPPSPFPSTNMCIPVEFSHLCIFPSTHHPQSPPRSTLRT
ncbi:hypothetical protein P280DRAFT_470557 [Massarina eburnea CBS 473.64]|uniref:Uncharacterized protein n=1 Tax=Massarina eburnea CBS 473.64 TaxID=1395130 RepID=A0A6A6RVH1_9PLEO|nr:hypothetical protein P280DRAFT_470557 [Massarina eburnea CBS 473.64]